MKYIKTATYLFFLSFILVLFYITLSTQNNLTDTVNSNVSNENEGQGLISLPVDEKNLTYKGTIRSVKDQEYKFSLNNQDKVVLYLKSDNQDLSLLSGLEAEVVGDIVGNYQAIAIMDVKSIKLK